MINWLTSGQWCFIECIFCTLERVTPCIETYPSINGPSLPRFVPFELRWLYQCSESLADVIFLCCAKWKVWQLLWTYVNNMTWCPYHWLFCTKVAAVAKSGRISCVVKDRSRWTYFCHSAIAGTEAFPNPRGRGTGAFLGYDSDMFV